jgi:hypothetical protein
VKRRHFLALASGLLIPEPERVRAYSFLPGANIVAERGGFLWAQDGRLFFRSISTGMCLEICGLS